MTPRGARPLIVPQPDCGRTGRMNRHALPATLAALSHRMQPGLSIVSALCVMTAGFITAVVISGAL